MVKLTTQHYERRQRFFKSSNVCFEKDLKLLQDLIAVGRVLNKDAAQSWKVCDVRGMVMFTYT